MMRKKKSQEEYVLEVTMKHPDIEVIGGYVNSRTAITHRCKICGNIWDAKPSRILGDDIACKKCRNIFMEEQRKKYEKSYIERLNNIHPNIILLGKYINANHKTAHRCTICGYEWNPKPSNMLDTRYSGCPVCSGSKIGPDPVYKNSIWASEHREYFSRYMTEEQMKLYTPCSRTHLDFTCPDCGNIKNMSIGRLLHSGFACICEDGQSFPNKFVYNVLCQLNLRIKTEYSPEWANKKRYDDYLLDYNIIIENHGAQHYIQTTIPNLKLDTVIENDKIKYNMALQNGIKEYIILDCRKSTTEWIKSSIMNSKLPKIFNFTENDIDWVSAYKYAETNLTKTAIDMLKNGYTMDEVANQLAVTKSGIKIWIKKAKEIGIYNGKYKIRV